MARAHENVQKPRGKDDTSTSTDRVAAGRMDGLLGKLSNQQVQEEQVWQSAIFYDHRTQMLDTDNGIWSNGKVEAYQKSTPHPTRANQNGNWECFLACETGVPKPS